jgi:pimeloyl-ACP methyl ester carboxylesterase
MSAWGLMLLAVALAQSSPAALAPCRLQGPQGSLAWGECGVVDVPLDPARPTPTVAVGFARLPATGSDDVREPVVLLAGGPGQAATRDFVPVLPALEDLRARHDLVLVDVRGTGRSTPQACRDDRPLAARLVDDDAARLVAACAATLTLDARFLATADAARDVDAVRAALGVPRWNVVGVSYGTRLAVMYDQLFPGRARTLVLDGVAPLDRALGDDIATDMTASLRALGDEAVSALVVTTGRLAQVPIDIVVTHPTTAQPLSLRVTPGVLFNVVRMLLYGNETRAVLPHLLRQAEHGDVAPLVALAVLSAEQLEGALHVPVNASVLCAEDAPRLSSTVDPTAVFPDERTALRRQCAVWPSTPRPPFVFAGTATPALLLSGEHDPITPPRHVERVLGRFADAVHVVVPGHGHNVLPRGCVADVAADFIDAGTARGLDTACVARGSALPVFVDALGPSP